MDRSFLSQPSVVAASRRFVCIRPLSYENEQEARYLRAIFVGRSGEVENTTFCFISADGKRLLTQPSRVINTLFRDADSMAQWMAQAADAEKAPPAAASRPALPLVVNPRLALNVAAADNQPLVVLHAEGARDRARLERALTELAWKEEFAGRVTYVVTTRSADLSPVTGAGAAPGVLVVQPDRFGLKGSVLARAADTATAEQLTTTLREGLSRFRPNTATGFEHMREGQRLGVYWETLLPVTDPLEAQARERTRRQAPAK